MLEVTPKAAFKRALNTGNSKGRTGGARAPDTSYRHYKSQELVMQFMDQGLCPQTPSLVRQP